MLDNDFQFYPTPRILAERAWELFKTKKITRLLEPHAGEAHLIEPRIVYDLNSRYFSRSQVKVDCLEIDISKHPILRAKGLNVIGLDFLQFQQGAVYSHIIMNPPFANGVHHLLHAWDIMYDGEIVAIINAQTIKKPFSKERKHLVSLIEKYGSVEFHVGAFISAEMPTDVEIAIVYLRKVSDVATDVYGDILASLKKDTRDEDSFFEDFQEVNAVVLPKTYIENQVAAFNAAVLSAKQAIFAKQRAGYYANVLGNTMERLETGFGLNKTETIKEISETMHLDYLDLKNRAWTSILRSTEVTSRLSSQAQKRLESEFELIKMLEFNLQNIYGFLSGLVDMKGDMQIGMALDVFDLISKYHSDNSVFFMGWKSNDAHRTCGRSIKAKRFILPNNQPWANALKSDSLRVLGDIDKVFAMLDGKNDCEIGLKDIFNNEFRRLKNGERVDATYFSVRYYPGIGTIHFYPKDKKLIDRLNRLVGAQRAWLPPSEVAGNEAFWDHYNNAEKYDKEFRDELQKSARGSYDDPFWGLSNPEHENHINASNKAIKAMTAVLERCGVNVDAVLSKQEVLMLETS